MTETIVELRNITKRFPGIVANDDVTLDIRKGEIFALLGENGAVKSETSNTTSPKSCSVLSNVVSNSLPTMRFAMRCVVVVATS
jgi:ABC-type branched-subunit amino acid transport system ATPase component